MCPFCYMGKRKFELALERFHSPEEVKIVWKSFQLQPDLITDYSLSVHEHLAAMKGYSVREARELNENVSMAASEVGLEYNFDKAVVANTFRAHILLHYAKKSGKQDHVKEQLFKSYFTDGLNVDDTDVLIKIAEDAGLDKDGLISAINDEACVDEVREDIYEAGQFGIRGVPFFVFDRKYAVSGAQDPEVFLETLEKAYVLRAEA